MDFENQVVLITGSSRGIGKQIALSFAKKGAHVILNGSKNKEQLLATEQEILSFGGSCMTTFGDVANYEFVQTLFEKIDQKYKKIDVLINNAGISHIGLFTDLTPTQWKRIVDVNLTSVYNCCHFAVKKMLSSHVGNIINISSIWGVTGASCEVAYSTTKGAMNAFTKALAKELGPSNIRVNAIACGVIHTEMNEWLSEEEKQDLIDEIPLMKMGTPHDVADLCLYLASEKAKYLTAQIIPLDGGMI